MNRREASKAETRNLIIAAARKLLLEGTQTDFTMRRIAKEAGVSAASVVVHFKNKQVLLETTLQDDIDHAIDAAMADLPRQGDLMQQLLHIWRAMFDFYDTNRELYRMMIKNTIFEQETETPYMTQQMNAFMQFVQQMIESEKAAGRLHPSTDCLLLCYCLMSHYFSMLILFFRSPHITPAFAVDLLAKAGNQTLTGALSK